MLCKSPRNAFACLAVAVSLTACIGGGGTTVTSLPQAKQITDEHELIGGPLARGQVGDFLLENDRIRLIVQQAADTADNVAGYGGVLIDADYRRLPGIAGSDRFGSLTPIFNGARTLRPARIFVLEDGSASGRAVVRVEGADAPYLGPTPEQQAVAAGLAPAGNRDATLSLRVVTDYILEPGANYVEVRTTFINSTSSQRELVVGDMVDAGLTHPFVSRQTGFALPTTPASTPTLIMEADDVSYGYLPGRRMIFDARRDPTAENLPAMLVAAMPAQTLGLFLGARSLEEAVDPEATEAERRLVVPANGSAAFSRYFVVGEGDASGVFQALSRTQDTAPARMAGHVTTVTHQGEVVAVAGADIAAFQNGRPVGHFKSDANGRFTGILPPGKYRIAANAAGHPQNAETDVELVAGDTVDVGTLGLAAAARLRLYVRDVSFARDTEGEVVAQPVDLPLPARIGWTPLDNQTDPAVLTAGGTTMLPFRPAAARSAVLSANARGEAAVALEPGRYRFQAYHGPFFSTDEVEVELQGGRETSRVFELAKVVHPEGVVIAEFNARRQSAHQDAEALVSDAAASGVDLLVATDPRERLDLLSALQRLDERFATNDSPLPMGNRIAVGTGEQVATAGYGQFAAWPVWDAERPLATVPRYDGEKARLPSALIDDLATALPTAAAQAIEAARATPSPLIQVMRPFGSPATSERGYFDAADIRVDWTNGSITGPGTGLSRASIGLPEGDLWRPAAHPWNALTVLYAADDRQRELSLNAWFALLNLGYLAAEDRPRLPELVALADGGSDEFAVLPAGQPRNIVLAGIALNDFRSTEGYRSLSALATLNDALRAGRNVMSNGPWIEIELAPSAATSNVVSLGEFLQANSAITDVTVTVHVQSPCWAPVEHLDFYLNTFIEEPLLEAGVLTNPPEPVTSVSLAAATQVLDGRTGAADADACRNTGTGLGRYSAEISHVLSGLTADAWLVVVARGSGFLPALSGNQGPVAPIAISNPIYVQADAGTLGNFTPLCPGSQCPNDGTTRLGWR